MPIQPRNILWPTDLSRPSACAAKYAAALSQTFGSRLHVIHVAPALAFDSSVAVMTAGDALVGATTVRSAASAALKRFVATHLDNVDLEQNVLVGNPWQEVCRYATSARIDLIVMATQGLSGIKHVLLGSTAERIVQHAPCPVLTVKCKQRDWVEPPAVRRKGAAGPAKKGRRRAG